jgi:hypothetical protein
MTGDEPDSFTVGPASVPVVNPWPAGTPALPIRTGGRTTYIGVVRKRNSKFPWHARIRNSIIIARRYGH